MTAVVATRTFLVFGAEMLECPTFCKARPYQPRLPKRELSPIATESSNTYSIEGRHVTFHVLINRRRLGSLLFYSVIVLGN